MKPNAPHFYRQEHLRRWWATLQEINCANPHCKKLFKQHSPRQIFCTPDCTKAKRPWNPKIKAVYDEFEKFCAKHAIPRATIVDHRLWDDIAKYYSGRPWEASEQRRSALAHYLKIIMDKFRRGFYYLDPGHGCKFQNPPWKPYCPVDHTYCKGAILPGDCPPGLKECDYSKTNWHKILQLRGIYAITVDSKQKPNNSGGSYRALIAGSLSGERSVPGRESDGDAIRPDAATGKGSPRPAAPNGHGIQAAPDSL